MSAAVDHSPKLRVIDALDMKVALALWWRSVGAVHWTHAEYEFLRDKFTEIVGALDQHRRDLEALLPLADANGVIPDSEAEPVLLAREQITMLQRAADAQEAAHGDLLAKDGAPAIESALRARSDRLRAADTYWIAEPMVTLTDAAEPSMPEQPLHPEDPPAPLGFTVPQVEPVIGDGTGQSWRVFAAVSWEPATWKEQPGLRLTFWIPAAAVPERLRQTFRTAGTPLLPAPMFWPYGEPLPVGLTEATEVHAARWVAAFWSLLRRPLVGAEPGHVERHAARRAVRAGVVPNVTVVTLRTPRGTPSEGPRPVNWSHRWMVRGFWRQQWYPTVGAHRAIWVDAYIKGPEDRPLVIKDRVYAWRR